MFRLILENGKVDLIAEKNNKYLRMQIKTVQKAHDKKIIPLRKISHNMGDYKIKYYTSKDIDFFIGVDLDTESIYILPIKLVEKYKSTIQIDKCTQFKNNFNQLELIIRNNNNGGNDNDEPLTDNADGNVVGINNI